VNRALDWIAPAFAFLIYTNAPAIAVSFHGAPFVVAAGVPLLLCLPVARDVVLRGEKIVITPAFGMLLLLLMVQFLGGLFAMYPEQSVASMFDDAIEALLIYLLVTNAVRTPRTLARVTAALVAAGAFIGALAAHQQVTGSFDSNYGGFSQATENELGVGDGEAKTLRLAGPIGEQNRFAQIMAMLVPIALFQALAARSRTGAVAAWAGLVLILIGFAMALSRGAVVGLGLMCLVMVALGMVRWKHVALATVGVAVTVLVVPAFGTRVLSLIELAGELATNGSIQTADGAVQGRATEMIASAMVFADHPILGVGPGMNSLHYVKYARLAGGKVRPGARRSHSLYLGLAAEHGILGLLSYFGMIAFTFRDLRAARHRWAADRPRVALLADGLLLSLVVYLTTSIFLHAAYNRYFWLILGLAGATGAMRMPSRSADLLRWLATRVARTA
jgi:O-antigen ligase